jgi:hypothetical protein
MNAKMNRVTSRLLPNAPVAILIAFTVLMAVQVSQSRVLDGALALAEKVDYPTESLMLANYLSSWSLAEQLSAALLALGFSGVVVSLAFSLVLNVGLPLVHFAICRAAGLNKWWSMGLSIAISIAISPIQLLFRSDYPLLLGTSWTHGELGLLVAGVILAAVVFEKFRLAGFLSGLFFALHSVWALYVLGTVILLVLLPVPGFRAKRKARMRRTLLALLGGGIASAISLAVFLSLQARVPQVISPISNVESAAAIYFQFWDFHRNIPLQVIPVGLSVVVGLIVLWGVLPKAHAFTDQPSRQRITAILLGALAVTSSVAYIVFHFVQSLTLSNIPSSFLNFVIPGRFMNLHAFFAFPLIYLTVIAVLAFLSNRTRVLVWLKSGSARRNVLLLTSAAVAGILVVVGSMQILALRNATNIAFSTGVSRLSGIPLSAEQLLEDLRAGWPDELTDGICPSLAKAKNVAAIGASSIQVPRYCGVPVILETSSVDVFAYTPKLLPSVLRVISDVFGIDPSDPTVSMKSGGISPEDVREVWTSRTSAEWLELSCRFGFDAVTTPRDWILQLPKLGESNGTAVFEIAHPECASS